MTTNHIVRLNDQYTAYAGGSQNKAIEVMEIVRNVLIRAHATGIVTRLVNLHVIDEHKVENGMWTAE